MFRYPVLQLPQPLSETKKRRLADDFKFPTYATITQAALMLISSLLFLVSDQASSFICRNLGFIEDYIPSLYRYGAAFAARGRREEFFPFFAIYVFDMLFQILALSFLMCFLIKRIRGERFNRLSSGTELSFFLILLFFAAPSIDLFVGLTEFETPGYFKNGLLYGNYFTAVFIYCLIVPTCNLIIYFLIYGRYILKYYSEPEPKQHR